MGKTDIGVYLRWGLFLGGKTRRRLSIRTRINQEISKMSKHHQMCQLLWPFVPWNFLSFIFACVYKVQKLKIGSHFSGLIACARGALSGRTNFFLKVEDYTILLISIFHHFDIWKYFYFIFFRVSVFPKNLVIFWCKSKYFDGARKNIYNGDRDF